jgi:hypothetical protein
LIFNEKSRLCRGCAVSQIDRNVPRVGAQY